MNRQKLLRWGAAVVACIGLAACSGSDEPDEAAQINAAPLNDGSEDADNETTGELTSESADEGPADDALTSAQPGLSRPIPTSPANLTATLPDEEPDEAAFTIVNQGTGEAVKSGDTAYLAWEMVNFDTGAVVESTDADYGSPVPILLGSGQVPAALENAVIGQKTGTRLEVLFPAGMADLPLQFDANQAHILAVEIVEIADFDLAAPPADPATSESDTPDPTDPPGSDTSEPDTTEATTTSVTQPTTTARPTPVDGLLVAAGGPLSVTSPVGSALPTKNDWDYVSEGSGEVIREGDTVQLEYVMVSWRTGQVVKSTAQDFGGPQSIVLGEIEIPRYLESAIFQKRVGTRLQVVYAADLFDLPEGLDRGDAYVVAVDIVGRSAG